MDRRSMRTRWRRLVGGGLGAGRARRGGRAALAALGLVALLGATPAGLAQELRNGNFEAGSVGEAPAGWTLPGPIRGQGWRAELAEAEADGGGDGLVVRLFNVEDAGRGFGNLMQSIDATELRGKRIRLTGRADFAPAGQARLQMWLRVDRVGGAMGAFDNMGDRPVTEAGWRDLEIIADVADDAAQVAIGVFINGDVRSSARIDDLALEVLGDAGQGDRPAAPLSARGVDNVAALGRLFGAVRRFHPSDGAREADWPALLVAAIDAVEEASDAEALAERLAALLAPIAPTVQVWAGDADAAPPRVAVPTDGTTLLLIEHRGLGATLDGTPQSGVYSSRLLREPADALHAIPAPPFETILELAGGVTARIPHVVAADDEGTLPRAVGAAATPERPASWRASPGDRSVRLAAVIEAWNVWQHFYPYWDVLDVDWTAELERGLRAAAEADGREGLERVLLELVAAADDGHGRLTVNPPMAVVPAHCAWVEGELVVVDAAIGTDLRAGDVIESIEGREVAAIYAEVGRRISASREGWRRFRAIPEILGWGEDNSVEVEVRGVDGARRSVEVERGPANVVDGLAPTRPELCAEVAPGIRYVDLHGLEWPALQPWLGELAAAKGIVFDMRGYPGGAAYQLFAHLSDEPIRSAYWRIPRYRKPDQVDVEYDESRWNIPPAKPRLPENLVFLTDGRAISYAESCMAIVEAYDLGEMVGAPTAGTNGNINTYRLPGGFGMVWTGMRVVQHDGETVHQGVGVHPTVPCAPTIEGIAAGRDELLERAIEVALENAD